jgi:hypothetical protein
MTTATAVDMRAVRAAAVERKKRERTNHYESYTELERLRAKLDGRELPRMDPFMDTFAGAATASQFFDDRILEWTSASWVPVGLVLVAIADAAQEGAGAAIAEVKPARQLDRAAQWTVYQNLEHWRQHADAAKTGAEAIVRAVEREWARLGLAEADPDAKRPQAEGRPRKAPRIGGKEPR